MRFALSHKEEGTMLHPLFVNSYVVFDRSSKQAIIIDPSVRDSGIEDLVRTRGLRFGAILTTHHHPDHTDADSHYSDLFQVPVCAHKKDSKDLSRPPDRYLEDGETLDNDGLIANPGRTISVIRRRS